MRTCRVCLIEKSTDSFYPKRRECKTCVIRRVHANPNRRAHDKRYHDANRVRLNTARVERQRHEDGSRQARYRQARPEVHAAVEARRRARKAGGQTEVYDRKEIYERDGGVCQLCEVMVDLALAWPDLMSFSIDHKVPISRGGSDIRDNVQTAHLICNIRKGAAVFGGV